MKRLLIIIIVPILFSCTKEENSVSSTDGSNPMEVLFFSSQSDLLETINTTQGANQSLTKVSNKESFESLFTLVSDIIIEDDVWIGLRSILTPGRHVQKGTIVAIGSVLTKDFPPYSVVGGNPAKVIKSRNG